MFYWIGFVWWTANSFSLQWRCFRVWQRHRRCRLGVWCVWRQCGSKLLAKCFRIAYESINYKLPHLLTFVNVGKWPRPKMSISISNSTNLPAMKTWVIFSLFSPSCYGFRNIGTLLWSWRKLLPKIVCHLDVEKRNVAWNNNACCHRQHDAQERSKINNNKSIRWKRIACTNAFEHFENDRSERIWNSCCISYPFECILFYRLTDTMRFCFLLTMGIITRRYAKKTRKNIEKKKMWTNLRLQSNKRIESEKE